MPRNNGSQQDDDMEDLKAVAQEFNATLYTTIEEYDEAHREAKEEYFRIMAEREAEKDR